MRLGVGLAITQPRSVAFSPLSLAPALWLDAADTSTITASGGAVSQWNDKSGNGKHLAQTTAAAQPTTAASTLNGRNVLTFDGGDWLQASTANDWTFLHDGSASTVWIVARAGNTANPLAAYTFAATANTNDGATRGWSLYYEDRSIASTNDSLRHAVTTGVPSNCVSNFSAADALPANTWARLRVVTDADAAIGADRSIMAVNNGSSIANNTITSSVSGSVPSAPFTVGGRNLRLVGGVAEVIVVNGALTANQIAAAESYLAAKWGL